MENERNEKDGRFVKKGNAGVSQREKSRRENSQLRRGEGEGEGESYR